MADATAQHPGQAGITEPEMKTPDYQPPRLTLLGDVAGLTQADKTSGSADGSMFLGLDIGSA